MFVFLQINGLYLNVPEPEVVVTMQQLAEGKTTQEGLAAWLKKYSRNL